MRNLKSERYLPLQVMHMSTLNVYIRYWLLVYFETLIYNEITASSIA